ncbi:MAG: TraR/DksA C4-type zinc finger protein [Armatimonadota bacterium]|nr:TraR/DksA C4-type zinc finger protein [Armatimonadota bacterium]
MAEKPQIDPKKFRPLLEQERERLMKSVHPEGDTRLGEDSADFVGDLSDYPDHPADLGTETFERDKDAALRDNARDLLEGVENALLRMDSGSYGLCATCGKPIPEGRLLALPSAVNCVPCQTTLEGR